MYRLDHKKMDDSLKTPIIVAGVWRRGLAYMLDILVLVVGFSVVGGITMGLTRHASNGMRITTSVVVMVVGMFVYFVYSEGKFGKTVGMHVLRLKVVPFAWPNQTGIGLGRALLRFIVRFPSAWVLYLGLLWALINPYRRTWYDLAAKAFVIHDPTRRFDCAELSQIQVRPSRKVWFSILLLLSIFYYVAIFAQLGG